MAVGGIVMLHWMMEPHLSADTYAAPCVRDIEQELFKGENWPFYANDPRTPQVVALRRLNQPAKAQEAGDRTLAQQLVQDALEVFEEGVRRHYYSSSEVERSQPLSVNTFPSRPAKCRACN